MVALVASRLSYSYLTGGTAELSPTFFPDIRPLTNGMSMRGSDTRSVSLLEFDGDGKVSFVEGWDVNLNQPTLTRVEEEPDGDNCLSGGKKIETGRDLNQNGALEESEVQDIIYVCD